MTEEQKRELERQANSYSFDFIDRIKKRISADEPNIKFMALSRAVRALGYKFVEDCKDELLGVEYKKYKIVKINE